MNNETEPAHVETKDGAEMDWELGGDENAQKREATLKLASFEIDGETPISKTKTKRARERESVEPTPKRVDKGKGVQLESPDSDNSEPVIITSSATVRYATEIAVAGPSGTSHGDTTEEEVDDSAQGGNRDLTEEVQDTEAKERAEEHPARTAEDEMQVAQSAVDSPQTEIVVSSSNPPNHESTADKNCADQPAQGSQGSADPPRGWF